MYLVTILCKAIGRTCHLTRSKEACHTLDKTGVLFSFVAAAVSTTTLRTNETDSGEGTTWITKVKYAAGAGILLAAIIVALILFFIIRRRRKKEREGNNYYIKIYIQIFDAQT